MNEPLAGAAAALCIVFAALIAVIAVYSVRRERRRKARLQQWADRNGWTLTLRPDVDWGRRLPGGNRHGVGPTFSAILDGRPVSVAEYSVTDASDGTTTNTHHHVVTVARLSRPLPPTQVEPRGRTSRLKNRILGPGDTATGNPDFDREFRIHTNDPATLHHWFTAPLITAHLTRQVPPSWSVQGTELLCHQPGRLNPNQIRDHAAAVLPLADQLDRHLGP
ncbi:hypothetical protein ACIBSW_17275 [Actinoplanes sp. NPDC049668]|uniref:hypothetical protein n=1 Tax=unclassified Actinoplanes TaxID=2626549 RepID=UPI0033BBA2D9